MNLLLDNGLPRSATALLTAQGHHAVHVGDIGLASATDSVILERAITDQSTIITLDADFHTLLALTSASRPSVIRLRIEGLKAAPLTNLLATVLTTFSDELSAGAVITVTTRSARARRLPII
jgi:predicted nuclease of predicted toxin-antitoxin system